MTHAPSAHREEREGQAMESLSSGTFVGAGSFRCRRCGYVLTLSGSDTLTDCPECAGQDFERASLFSTERMPADAATGLREGTLSEPAPVDHDVLLAEVRDGLDHPG